MSDEVRVPIEDTVCQAWWSRLLRAVLAVGFILGMVQLSRPPAPPTPGATWHWSGIAALVALFLIITGPQPRLATRWAWFWLWAVLPPTSLLFVALEPAPLWQRVASEPAHRRVTGGWALLVGLGLAGFLDAFVPVYAQMFPR